MNACKYTGDQMAWFENPGKTGAWEQHSLATGIGETRTARVADINGDETFTAHDVDAGVTAPTHGEPVDMDGDGRLDIVAAAENVANEVRWWRNEPTAAARP
ncbi:MAG: hypothetical protein IT426_06675 [Pirellulales bacterium]|nr:hypothetical protein [Pirellulales bacterium]